MPIDPNIALSYRQPEPVNMLGQLGQVMAIKAAQQEMEGYEGVKGALSSGMEATDPRLLQYGKRGIEAFKAANEGRIKQLEAVTKQSQLLGSIFGGVMQDPSSGPAALKKLESMGIVKPDEAQAILAQAGNDPAAWKAIAKPYYDQSIDATKRFQDETERWKANLQAQVTREGHGVQMYGHNVAREGHLLNDRRAREQLHAIETGEGPGMYSQFGPNAGVIRPMTQAPWSPPGTPAPQMTSPTVAGAGGNAFVTMRQPQQPVSLNNLANQQAAPTQQPQAEVGYTRATPKISGPTLTEVIDPNDLTKMLKVDARVYKQGTGQGSPGVLGVSSVKELSPQEKQQAKQEVLKDYKATSSALNNGAALLDQIQDVKKAPGLKDATGYGAYIMSAPGGKAAQAEVDLANLVGKIQAYARNAANETGKIGSMQVQEWQILADQAAAIRPKAGREALIGEINKLEHEVKNLMNRSRATYEKGYANEFKLFPDLKDVPEPKRRHTVESDTTPGVIDFSSMK